MYIYSCINVLMLYSISNVSMYICSRDIVCGVCVCVFLSLLFMHTRQVSDLSFFLSFLLTQSFSICLYFVFIVSLIANGTFFSLSSSQSLPLCFLQKTLESYTLKFRAYFQSYSICSHKRRGVVGMKGTELLRVSLLNLLSFCNNNSSSSPCR